MSTSVGSWEVLKYNLQSGLSAPIKRYHKPFEIIAYNMVLHRLLSTGGK